jgi:hypothetical protein
MKKITLAMYKKSKPFEIDWSAEPQEHYKDTSKRHYWRGVLSGALFVIFLVAIIYMTTPAPDYTMTPAQYQAYLTACKN